LNIPLISLPLDKRIVTLIPDARIVGDRLHVAHTPATTVLLKTIGITLPPAVTRYDYVGGKPFEVQKRTVELLTQNPRAYVLNSFGTGKTKSALWSFDFLRSQNLAKRMLVVAPLSTLRFTWAREAFATVPHLSVNVLHGAGGAAKRLKLLAEPVDVYVINPDGLGVIIEEVIKRTDIDVICIDELATFRNRTIRTAHLKRIAQSKTIVWGMTGAPTPNHPTDVYHQSKIITPRTCPMSFVRFRDETMVKVGDFRWVPRPDATEKAMQVLRPHVRYTLDDVTELPTYVSQYTEVPLSELQATVYKEIKQHCYAMTKNKEITTSNAAVAMIKLLQVSMGWVYGSDGTVIDLDGTPRLEALRDLIEAGDHKVLVFVPYKHALAGVYKFLTDAGIESAVVSGDTSARDRGEIFNLFQNTVKYKALIAHPAVASHGLTLTAANTVVWFGPITSLELYDQANARIRRVGQAQHQLFVHMHSTPIEKYVYRLLINKIINQDQLLRLLEEATEA